MWTEDFVGRYDDSRRTCGYQQSDSDAFESRQGIKDVGLPFILLRQRTTVYFEAQVHVAIRKDDHDISNGS